MKNLLVKMHDVFRPFHRVILIILFNTLILQGLGMLVPLIHGKAIDVLIGGKTIAEIFTALGSGSTASMFHLDRLGEIMALVAVLFGISIIQETVFYFAEKFEQKNFQYSAQTYLSEYTNNKLFGLSIGQHHRQHSGSTQSIIGNGEAALTGILDSMVYRIFPLVLMIFLTLAGLLFLSPLLALVVLISISVFIGITLFINFGIKEGLAVWRDKNTETGKKRSEILRHTDIIIVNASEKKVGGEYLKHAEKTAAFGIRLWLGYLTKAIGRDISISFGECAVVALGAWLVLKGEFTPGYLVVFVSWSNRIFGQIGSLGQQIRQLLRNSTAAEKYFSVVEAEPDVKQPENPVWNGLRGRIEFQNVSFAYPARSYASKDGDEIASDGEENEAISDVNFVAEPGQKIAVVGSSGAGKSTLVQLLLRAYDPQQGRILVDGIDLRELDLEKFRHSVGYVEQDVRLFDNSLENNISLGRNGKGELSEAELNLVSKMAGVDKFFHRLPKGYSTIIGEKGIKLSGGERQRVGIARALAKEPSILILDEATSNLDSRTEALIRDSIEKASVGRTTIIVAHRLSTVVGADVILVMDEGRIIARGRHEELMVSCEQYKKLVENQTCFV